MNADAPNKAVFFKKSLRVFIINKIKINHYILKALLNGFFKIKNPIMFFIVMDINRYYSIITSQI